MLREKSCGIVPFREADGEILYLVISSAVTKREHWEFPKGGVEEGEREIETALRELWEETGVQNVRVLPGYREPIRYIYRRPEGLVSKQVVYFIARVADPRVKLREEEAKDYRWANYEESRKLLRHANARALLERCHAFITGKPIPARARPLPVAEKGDAAEAEQQRRRGSRRRRRGEEGARGGPQQARGQGAQRQAAEAERPGGTRQAAQAAQGPTGARVVEAAAAKAPNQLARAEAPKRTPERTQERTQERKAGPAAAADGQPGQRRRKRRRRRGGRRQEHKGREGAKPSEPGKDPS